MKKYFLLLFLIPSIMAAQLTIVSVLPANNSKSVPLTATISITFSEALDTLAMKEKGKDSWFSNIDSVVSDWYSADAKTRYAVVMLKSNTDYFIAVMYAKAKSGAVMTMPYVYYFTTGTNFSPYSVSGTLSPGAMDVTLDDAVVALAKINFMETETDGPPPFGGWASVNPNGTFTIPNVANGTYWPFAVKDVDQNGNVDPGKGVDLLVMGDSIVVNNASVTGLELTFFDLISFSPANLATNVPLATTLSFTFSEPLDTNAMSNESESSWFTNIDNVVSYWYSADLKTSYTSVILEPNKSYFMAFTYVKARSGAMMTTPRVSYFTTGSSFNPYSVSGSISPGSTDISPEGSVVGLSTINFMEENVDGPPPFGGWANVNSNGTFTIPFVANGKYWPLVAKDVDHDGLINPEQGKDVVVMGDSIIVNNASVTGVDLTFFDIVSFQPANLSTNVPLNTTISMTFSEPLDTMAMKESEDSWFSNIDSIASSGFSADGKTSYAQAVLKPNTTYFIAFMYVKSKYGGVITSPQIFYFTTGAALEPLSVSGTVSSGSTGISPAGAIVGLAKIDFMNKNTDGTPPFGGWGIVNNDGTFTIPYVPNGTYWPMAAKDVDHDGKINPDNGVDAMAYGDSIVVNNVSLTGVNLTFFTLTPNLFHDVIHKADSMAAANLPADRSLRRISGWEVDIQGRARSWEFAYSINGNTQGKSIHLGTMDYSIDDIDPMYFQWLSTMKEITNYDLAASSAAVIANVEAAGGTMVREQPIPSQWEFAIELSLSDQKNGWFGGSGAVDTSKIYWAAAYAYNYQVNPDQNQWMGGRLFLCDFATGSVLDTRDIIMDVKNEPTTVREFRLSQNYPNPFNPTTVIEFTVAQRAPATLKIFNVLGQEVAELFNSTAEPGQKYKVVFNAKNLSSGIYFSRLESNGRSELKKLVLLR